MTIDPGHIVLSILLLAAVATAAFWIGYESGRHDQKKDGR